MNKVNIKTIVLLLGKRGAGKTTLAEHLVQSNNYFHIEMSNLAKLLRKQHKLETIRLRRFVDIMHKDYSSDFAIKYAMKELYKERRNTVITGIRNLSEFNYLQTTIKDQAIVAIYIDVNIFKRLFRTASRKDRGSIVEFFIEEYYSFKWGDKKLRFVSTRLNNNNENLNEVMLQLERLIVSGQEGI